MQKTLKELNSRGKEITDLDLDLQFQQHVVVNVDHRRNRCLFVAVFRFQGATYNDTKELCLVLDQLVVSNDKVEIAGDFNVQYLIHAT